MALNERWTSVAHEILINVMTERAFEVRPATMDDVGEIDRLIRRSMRSLGVRDYSPAQVESVLKYAMGVDTLLIADGTYFVVTDAGRIIGAGGWSYRRMLHGGDGAKVAGDEQPLDPRRDAARVRAFFVDPDYARRGIGRALMDLCELEASRAGFTRMELAATLTGMHLYRACGFMEIERVELTLPDGTPAVLVRMGKTIRAVDRA